MTDERVREDLAVIRAALEEGRAYATACGSDMAVWGIAVAIGHLATYAFVRHWSGIAPAAVWAMCIGLPWLYSLRGVGRRAVGAAMPAVRPATVTALRMLWLAVGIFLTSLAAVALASGEGRFGWFDAVVAGTLGVGVFVTAWLAALPWLRWIALGWWAGEVALFALRQRPERLLLGAVLMLLLLAGPGLALIARRRRPA